MGYIVFLLALPFLIAAVVGYVKLVWWLCLGSRFSMPFSGEKSPWVVGHLFHNPFEGWCFVTSIGEGRVYVRNATLVLRVYFWIKGLRK